MEMSNLELVARFMVCRNKQGLSWAIQRCARACGFEHWMQIWVKPRQMSEKVCLYLGNFPPTWVERYFTNGRLDGNPIVAHCRQRCTPLVWYTEPDSFISRQPPAYQHMFREAKTFGLISNVSFPVHSLGGEWGLLSLSNSTLVNRADLQATLPIAQLMALYINEAGRHFSPEPERLHLTKREQECLQYGAFGMTSREIGRLIGVRERTVVFHFYNAVRKLGVTSRQSAVARAAALGVISL